MKIAFCGLNCMECPIFIATQTQDEVLKEQIARDYSTDTFLLSKEDITCTGCHEVEGACKKMCVECDIRKCGMEKELEHCGACAEFPCNFIEKYAPTESKQRQMLENVRKR